MAGHALGVHHPDELLPQLGQALATPVLQRDRAVLADDGRRDVLDHAHVQCVDRRHAAGEGHDLRP